MNGWRFEMDVQNEHIVFVFGSNLAGRHGKGAALSAARFHGAIRGQGVGFMGSCYAIPTKGYQLEVLPLNEIEKHVHRFLVFATMNQKLKFRLTPVGCGLAGYRPDQIAPMFKGAPSNIIMPAEFKT
ncbi:macro domain-containing protein [Agrobacterium phage Milano]|nr:macro domain-containing protein [Agrobacterium phage Milano]